MDTATTISFATIIAIVGFAYTCYNFAQSRKQNIRDEDSHMAEIREGIIKLNLKSDNLCTNLNELRVDTKAQLEKLTERQQQHDKQIAVVERDLKTAFNKIDELREKMGE